MITAQGVVAGGGEGGGGGGGGGVGAPVPKTKIINIIIVWRAENTFCCHSHLLL